MDYLSGTHIIVAKKLFICESCKSEIRPQETYMMRRIVIIPNKQNDDKRYHFRCALNLPDLSEEERKKIEETRQNNANQDMLIDAIKKKLISCEYQGCLTFFFCNSIASITKSFLILTKNAQPFVVSVAPYKAPIPTWLVKKFQYIKKINGDVCNVSTIEEFEAVLKTYVNSN